MSSGAGAGERQDRNAPGPQAGRRRHRRGRGTKGAGPTRIGAPGAAETREADGSPGAELSLVSLSKVRFTNVRSRRALEVSLGPGLTILVGPNGAGKTTVLEAATLVLQGSMLRPGTIRDLITRGEDYLRVEIELREQGTTLVAAAAYSRAGDRRLTADGAPLDDASRWREHAPGSHVRPRRSASHQRQPPQETGVSGRSGRAMRPGVPALSSAATRRPLLSGTRCCGSQGGGSGDHDRQFGPWESILAQTGLAVTRGREAALSSFIGLFQRTHADLTGTPPMHSGSCIAPTSPDWTRPSTDRSSPETRDADRQRTYTHLGPHRDDLRLMRRRPRRSRVRLSGGATRRPAGSGPGGVGLLGRHLGVLVPKAPAACWTMS